MAAEHIMHIQKALDQMNLEVHRVLSDITGLSGLRILVLFQLNAPRTWEAFQRVVGIPQSAMSIAKVSIHALAAGLVVGIIRVGYGELFKDSKLGLNEIEPGGLGGSPSRVNVQLFQ